MLPTLHSAARQRDNSLIRCTVIIVENNGKCFTLNRVTLFEVEHHLFGGLLEDNGGKPHVRAEFAACTYDCNGGGNLLGAQWVKRMQNLRLGRGYRGIEFYAHSRLLALHVP